MIQRTGVGTGEKETKQEKKCGRRDTNARSEGGRGKDGARRESESTRVTHHCHQINRGQDQGQGLRVSEKYTSKSPKIKDDKERGGPSSRTELMMTLVTMTNVWVYVGVGE